MRYRVLIKFNPTAARVYIHIYEYGDGNDPIRMFVLLADRMPKLEQSTLGGNIVPTAQAALHSCINV